MAIVAPRIEHRVFHPDRIDVVDLAISFADLSAPRVNRGVQPRRFDSKTYRRYTRRRSVTALSARGLHRYSTRGQRRQPRDVEKYFVHRGQSFAQRISFRVGLFVCRQTRQ